MRTNARLSVWMFQGLGLSVLLAVACAPAAAPGPTSPPPKPAATAPPAAKPAAKPGSGPALTLAVTGLVEGMDPQIRFAGGPGTMQVYNSVFDLLVETDSKGDLKPGVAESWKQIDPTTWEFKLRSGVSFSNGDPLDALAVKFSVDRAAFSDPPLTVTAWVKTIKRVDVIDPMTVRIVSTGPDALFLRRLSMIYLIPPKYFERVGQKEFAANPIGSGPLTVKEWLPPNKLTLQASQNSWRPAIPSEIRMVTLREPATMAAALRAGEIDIAIGISEQQAVSLKADKQVVPFATDNIQVIDMDLLRAPEFKDKRVRQAANFAVDKEALVSQLLYGYGKVADGQLVSPGIFGYDPSLKPYPYDLSKAKSLLAEAGYPNGFKTTMQANAGVKAVSEAVAGYLHQAGIQIEVQILELPVFRDKLQRGTAAGGRAPLYNRQSTTAPFFDLDFAAGWMDPALPAATRRWENEEFGRLLAQSRVEADEAKRLKLLQQMSAIVREEAPVIFLHQSMYLFVGQKNVKGIDPRQDWTLPFELLTKE